MNIIAFQLYQPAACRSQESRCPSWNRVGPLGRILKLIACWRLMARHKQIEIGHHMSSLIPRWSWMYFSHFFPFPAKEWLRFFQYGNCGNRTCDWNTWSALAASFSGWSKSKPQAEAHSQRMGLAWDCASTVRANHSNKNNFVGNPQNWAH